MTDKQRMDKVLRDLESDEHVQQMKNYTQHGKVSTYEHCERVAKLSLATRSQCSYVLTLPCCV